MRKPKKPYKTFPLTPHVRGGWAKRYKGHLLYIAERDPGEALKKFNRTAKLIDDGRYKREKDPADVTVADVCTRYITERQKDVDAGTLSAGTLSDYEDATIDMQLVLGATTHVDDLTQDDFTRLFRKLSERLGSNALANTVQRCRTIWNHAEENGWIDRRPKYGTVFKKPPSIRKQGTGFTVEEARVLVACFVGSQLEAMTLLMLNGGFTAKDCAALPRSAVDLRRGVLMFPRPKMKRRRAIDRAVTLWPETLEALRDVMRERPDDELVFRTSYGLPWVQGKTDSINMLFTRMVVDLGWPRRGPSWLRHLFRTLADELEKPHAAARIMGHRLPGLADVYVDAIEHDRLRFITDHVRSRVWPAAPSSAGTARSSAPAEAAPRPSSAGPRSSRRARPRPSARAGRDRP